MVGAVQSDAGRHVVDAGVVIVAVVQLLDVMQSSCTEDGERFDALWL